MIDVVDTPEPARYPYTPVDPVELEQARTATVRRRIHDLRKQLKTREEEASTEEKPSDER